MHVGTTKLFTRISRMLYNGLSTDCENVNMLEMVGYEIIGKQHKLKSSRSYSHGIVSELLSEGTRYCIASPLQAYRVKMNMRYELLI